MVTGGMAASLAATSGGMPFKCSGKGGLRLMGSNSSALAGAGVVAEADSGAPGVRWKTGDPGSFAGNVILGIGGAAGPSAVSEGEGSTKGEGEAAMMGGGSVADAGEGEEDTGVAGASACVGSTRGRIAGVAGGGAGSCAVAAGTGLGEGGVCLASPANGGGASGEAGPPLLSAPLKNSFGQPCAGGSWPLRSGAGGSAGGAWACPGAGAAGAIPAAAGGNCSGAVLSSAGAGGAAAVGAAAGVRRRETPPSCGPKKMAGQALPLMKIHIAA